MPNFDFSTYLSPFTWRYGSDEMRTIFSEKHKIELWRKIWVALAYAQYKAGLLSKKELDDLCKNEKNFDLDRILEIEKETKHDVVASIKEFAQKAKIGGGKIHLGATSMDIVDNADILKIKEALVVIKNRLHTILFLFANLIEKYAGFPCLGYTHLQPAEPTTVGYRLSLYAQDFYLDNLMIRIIEAEFLKAKGFKGAVGTGASYHSLLKNKKMAFDDFEKIVLKKLGISAFDITSQVYPRKIDYLLLTSLASIAQSASKFACDLRILQSPLYGEWSEPFGKKQVGSSAMPFKKNPIASENICSLSRYVCHLPVVALENGIHSYLERTLDDSANKRVIMPEAFLATDQILITAEKIIQGLVINEKRITYNLNLYAPFAATEILLMEAVKNGANRQEMHENFREISLHSWQQIQDGKPNPMAGLLINNRKLNKYLKKNEIKKLLNVENHIGNAPQRALLLVKKIKQVF